jgi:predicted ATPase
VFRQPIVSRTFIGRREELSALQEARRDLASSHGGAVLIGGETGIGKSRLLAQFVNDLREGKSRRIVVTAECLERVQQPFGPIRTLVATLAEFVERDELPGNVRRAIAQLTRSSPELDHANATEALERADLLSALVELVKLVVARQAVVMTIEDLHWADSSTLDVLAYAIPRLARSRFLLVATFRSDELERNETLLAAVSQMLREPSVRRLALPAFSRSEIRDLIDDALGDRAALPASVRHDIEVRSEGNPFFAEELVKGALEAQSAGALASLPLSIRASILQRLATLSAEERRVLERAAVLGYRFDPALLALVTGSNVEALLPTLRRARDLNIVVEESDDARFRFRHALTRQTIYIRSARPRAASCGESGVLTRVNTLGAATRLVDRSLARPRRPRGHSTHTPHTGNAVSCDFSTRHADNASTSATKTLGQPRSHGEQRTQLSRRSDVEADRSPHRASLD